MDGTFAGRRQPGRTDARRRPEPNAPASARVRRDRRKPTARYRWTWARRCGASPDSTAPAKPTAPQPRRPAGRRWLAAASRPPSATGPPPGTTPSRPRSPAAAPSQPANASARPPPWARHPGREGRRPSPRLRGARGDGPRVPGPPLAAPPPVVAAPRAVRRTAATGQAMSPSGPAARRPAGPSNWSARCRAPVLRGARAKASKPSASRGRPRSREAWHGRTSSGCRKAWCRQASADRPRTWSERARPPSGWGATARRTPSRLPTRCRVVAAECGDLTHPRHAFAVREGEYVRTPPVQVVGDIGDLGTEDGGGVRHDSPRRRPVPGAGRAKSAPQDGQATASSDPAGPLIRR